MLITRCDSPAGIDFTVSVFLCVIMAKIWAWSHKLLRELLQKQFFVTVIAKTTV